MPMATCFAIALRQLNQNSKPRPHAALHSQRLLVGCTADAGLSQMSSGGLPPTSLLDAYLLPVTRLHPQKPLCKPYPVGNSPTCVPQGASSEGGAKLSPFFYGETWFKEAGALILDLHCLNLHRPTLILFISLNFLPSLARNKDLRC